MRSQELTVPVGIAAVMVLPPNPNRVSIIFSGDATNTFSFSRNPTVTVGKGITVAAAIPSIQIDSYEVGDNITGPWYGICSAAGGEVTIIEGFV